MFLRKLNQIVISYAFPYRDVTAESEDKLFGGTWKWGGKLCKLESVEVGVVNIGSGLTSGMQTLGEDGKVEGGAFMTENRKKEEKGDLAVSAHFYLFIYWL